MVEREVVMKLRAVADESVRQAWTEMGTAAQVAGEKIKDTGGRIEGSILKLSAMRTGLESLHDETKNFTTATTKHVGEMETAIEQIGPGRGLMKGALRVAHAAGMIEGPFGSLIGGLNSLAYSVGGLAIPFASGIVVSGLLATAVYKMAGSMKEAIRQAEEEEKRQKDKKWEDAATRAQLEAKVLHESILKLEGGRTPEAQKEADALRRILSSGTVSFPGVPGGRYTPEQIEERILLTYPLQKGLYAEQAEAAEKQRAIQDEIAAKARAMFPDWGRMTAEFENKKREEELKEMDAVRRQYIQTMESGKNARTRWAFGQAWSVVNNIDVGNMDLRGLKEAIAAAVAQYMGTPDAQKAIEEITRDRESNRAWNRGATIVESGG